ncbi:WD40-repeat-containing domain protein [Mycena filopes]|nr:WD40-repeat-containing domain protein [Mycena filopes]
MSQNDLKTVQISAISATTVLPPWYGLSAETRAYITIYDTESTVRLRGKLSGLSAKPVWGETFPPVAVSLSSTLVFKIYRRRPFFFLGFNRLTATRTITVGELVKMQESSLDDVISLEMIPEAATAGQSFLNLALHVQDLTASAVIGQIPQNAATKEQGTPYVSHAVAHIIVRLGTISNFAVALAELHPVAAAAVTLVKEMGKSIEHQLESDIRVKALMVDVDGVLKFVESAESQLHMKQHQGLIREVLQCTVDCVRYAWSGSNYGLFDLLTSDSTLRLKELNRLQNTLAILNRRLSESLLVDAAHSAFKTEKYMASAAHLQHLSTLKPVEMPMCSPNKSRNTRFPGTRAAVVNELTKWAFFTATHTNVFWMFGPSGTGKSTIATSIAEIFDALGYMGSFVFFDRDVVERANPSAFIRTIAYHLGQKGGPIADAIVAAVEKNPRVSEMGLARQFKTLILEPMATSVSSRPVIIIIDALDEGAIDGEVPVDFLAVLADGLPRLPKHVRVLITSRRDPKIVSSLSALPCVRKYDLSREPDIHQDIRAFMTARLEAVRLQNSLPTSWPGSESIDKLVEHASGLFIWAVVACTHIDSWLANERLIQLLQSTAGRDIAEAPLDVLYGTAICASKNWKLPDTARVLHDVLAAIVMAHTPLSAESIADLTGRTIPEVGNAVGDIHSILNVDDEGLVRVVHPSVRDYITNLARCAPNSPWHVDAVAGNSFLGIGCLELIGRRLTYNFMNLVQTVDFRRTQVRRDSSWTAPQYNGPASTNQFFSSGFLPWLEVLSVLKRSRDAIRLLGKLHSWCLAHKTTSLYDPRLCELIYDSWRFVNTFAQTIEAYPLLIYDTALPFLPRNTAIREVLTSQHTARVPEVLVGGLGGWDSCLYSMTRHRAPVQGLALCPQTKTVISAGWDVSLRMWNYETGVETQPRLNCAAVIAHRMSIASVQFSPDHSVVLTGSMDGTICCWDAKTNQLRTRLVDPATPRVIPVFAMPGTRIYSMAVLLHGNLIATGRQDGKVALWNLDDSNRADVDLVGHTDAVYCIHTNADRDFLVSGSADTTVRLWDVRARTSTKIYRGHTGAIRAVALSPDMSCIVSGSADNTVRLWATEDSAECAVLEGHTDEILAVAFSLDGRYIASGGRDHKICLWTVAGHRLFQRFTSHAGPIYSLLFCDPTRLISGTERGEVRAWRVSETQAVDNEMQWLHTGCVYAVALSNGGSLFASGCGSSTVILWNARTGHPVFPSLTNHAARITCLAFSPDDSTLASGSRDGTVYLLDTGTGNVLDPVLKFTSEVYFLAFCCHAAYLAIGLEDGTVVLWDTITHKRRLELSTTPHGSLRALALSNQPGKVGALYCEPDGAPGLVVWDDATGQILLQKGFTLDRDNLEPEVFLEGTHIAFSGDDSHVLIRYHYARDGLIETHAFDLTTGFEAPQIANSTRRLYAQNAEIYHGNTIIMPLPRDFKTTDIVRTWAVSGDVIMVGMDSGRVYAVNFGPRLQELGV